MKILEDSGFRSDNLHLQAITFKFPWYHDDNVIGLFGISIKIDAHALADFSGTMTKVINTGLLDVYKPSRLMHDNLYLSERETQVISLLVRGKTAKEIGLCLCISHRTVEHYIQSLKIKTNCNKKSELIETFIDMF